MLGGKALDDPGFCSSWLHLLGLGRGEGLRIVKLRLYFTPNDGDWISLWKNRHSAPGWISHG